MALTVVEHNPVSLLKHLETAVMTVAGTGFPDGHNYIQFTNLGSSRISATIDGTTPGTPPTSNGSTPINGFLIPESSVNGGVRQYKYRNTDFSSLKMLAVASGVDVLIEVSRVGPSLSSM